MYLPDTDSANGEVHFPA